MTDIWYESCKLILLGLWYTTLISFFALLFGTILGTGLCAMRLSKKKWHNAVAKYFIMVVRGFPALVLLMLLFYVILEGWHPLLIAIIAFSLNYSTHVADVFRVGYDSVSPTQHIAGLSLGLSKYKSFRHIVLPQMLQNCAPTLKDQVGGLIKATSIVGYIAIIDLTKAVDLIEADAWDPLFPLLIVGFFYFLFAWGTGLAIDVILKKI